MNVLITGCSRGIGLSLCKENIKRGHQVFAVCRQSNARLSETGAHVIEGVDVSDLDAIQMLKTQVEGVSFDLVINNAGILRDEVMGDIDYDSIMQQFKVNAIGPLSVSECLKDQIVKGGKIAFITSRMGSIADNTSGGRYGYRMSKAALNMAAMSISHDLREQGISVAILHPGLVGTDMIGGVGNITPDQAAVQLMQRIDQTGPENSGTFWHANGEVLPW